MECQYHNNCGGQCETPEEIEQNLCADCLQAEREADAEAEAYKRLRIAATNVVAAFEQLGKAQHAPELLIARSRCETVMVKLSEALKA